MWYVIMVPIFTELCKKRTFSVEYNHNLAKLKQLYYIKMEKQPYSGWPLFQIYI